MKSRVTTQDVDGYVISDTAYNTFLMAVIKILHIQIWMILNLFLSRLTGGKLLVLDGQRQRLDKRAVI